MGDLEHLLMPSALFLCHIRASVVVGESGKILSGHSCGRICADLSCIAFPMEDCGGQGSPNVPTPPEGTHSITHPVCTQTRMNIFGLFFLTTQSQSSGTDLSG